MKIDYCNMENGATRSSFFIHYIYNIIRTWFYFRMRFRNVKYEGFVRVMRGTSFGNFPIELGHNVQFGDYCNISTPAKIGNNVLLAGRVCFVGRNDHDYREPGKTIWQSLRKVAGPTIVEDDVWIGHRATIIGPVTIGRGSVIAAGAVVNSDIPPCEIWGGVPAKKLRDRFNTEEEKEKHLTFLNSLQ